MGLSGSGLLDHGLDRRWLAGTIIGALRVARAHLVLAVRVRIPVYELPDLESRRVTDRPPTAIPGRDGSAETLPIGRRDRDGYSSHGDPWLAFGYLVSGMLLYGLIGWLLDRWLGTSFLVVVGILVGITLGDLDDLVALPGAAAHLPRHRPPDRPEPDDNPHHQT